MEVQRIIFLIHPCCYEDLDSAVVRKDNLTLFVEREREVKKRWLDGLAEKPANALFVQLGGPEYLRDAAIEHLGEKAVFYPQTPFPESGDLAEYYRALAADFRSHVEGNGLELDVATVTSELWGESFEGCVPGYGGAFAQHLGLAISPVMRFEMTVYDSRFLHGVRCWEAIPVDNCDVEAWLFECHDGTGAAMFQARLAAQWLDERRVQVQLDDRRLQVCTKQGHTIWPEEPWEKGKSESVRPYSMTLVECNWRWIRAQGMAFDDFRKVIGSARVEGELPEL